MRVTHLRSYVRFTCEPRFQVRSSEDCPRAFHLVNDGCWFGVWVGRVPCQHHHHWMWLRCGPGQGRRGLRQSWCCVMRSTVEGKHRLSPCWAPRLRTSTVELCFLFPITHAQFIPVFLPSWYLKSTFLSKSPLLLSWFSCPPFSPEPMK